MGGGGGRWVRGVDSLGVPASIFSRARMCHFEGSEGGRSKAAFGSHEWFTCMLINSFHHCSKQEGVGGPYRISDVTSRWSLGPRPHWRVV
jgi:hypothetical protein